LACHLKIDADRDPAYHFNADPDPDFLFDADPYFLFDADPDAELGYQNFADPDPDPQHC
jgi:hypothetical protein